MLQQKAFLWILWIELLDLERCSVMRIVSLSPPLSLSLSLSLSFSRKGFIVIRNFTVIGFSLYCNSLIGLLYKLFVCVCVCVCVCACVRVCLRACVCVYLFVCK